jgi:AcrR family transcriptional regulator
MTAEADPRFQRSREAIVAAARELLLGEGPAAVTHNRIAEHSGIGRATVYRHWPRTDQLLAEAMATVPLPFFEHAASPYREWLRTELAAIARQLDQADVRAVTTTLANASLWDPAMDVRRAGFATVLADRLASALAQAAEDGELALSREAAAAAALTLGPLYYRATIEHAPCDASLIEAAIASVGDWTPSAPE